MSVRPCVAPLVERPPRRGLPRVRQDRGEDQALAQASEASKRAAVGVLDVPRALFGPRSVFNRVEDVATWGWPLLILLTLVTLIGCATVQTGLIDREVDRKVAENISQIDKTQGNVLKRPELRARYEQELKIGEFKKLLSRIQVVLAEPATALATILLVASVCYGFTALGGRKPEWNTLLNICVFAAYADALRLLVLLALRLHFGTLEVDTSASLYVRMLVPPEGLTQQELPGLAALAGVLTAVDPFQLWFWYLVSVGLRVTRQLPGWKAWAVCVLCWLVSAGVHCGLSVALYGQAAMRAGQGG